MASKPNKDPQQIVLKYMKDQNRPYSTNDVMMNLHKEFGKTAIQKALDNLVLEGQLVEKVNGKQKAYVINQESLPTANEEELASLDAQIKEAEGELSVKNQELKQAEAKLKELQSQPTNAEAEGQIAELESMVSNMEERLHKLSNEQNLVTKEEKESISKNHETAIKEWRKRKRMCTNVIDAILESYPKSKKDFFEEVGIETDEDMGVKIPDSY